MVLPPQKVNGPAKCRVTRLITFRKKRTISVRKPVVETARRVTPNHSEGRSVFIETAWYPRFLFHRPVHLPKRNFRRHPQVGILPSVQHVRTTELSPHILCILSTRAQGMLLQPMSMTFNFQIHSNVPITTISLMVPSFIIGLYNNVKCTLPTTTKKAESQRRICCRISRGSTVVWKNFRHLLGRCPCTSK